LRLEPEAPACIALNVEREASLLCLVVHVQKSDFHLINIFCAVIVVKNGIMPSADSLLVFCTT